MMIFSLAFAQQTLDCDGLTSTCALQNDMVVAVNGMMGSPQIHEAARVRNRPSTLYVELDALRGVAEPAGCTITGWTGGVYDTGEFDLLWDVVDSGTPENGSGTVENGSFVGTYEDGGTRPIGGTLSHYSKGGMLFADRGVAGFLVGRFLRDKGRRGVFAAFHGTCPSNPVQVFDDAFDGKLDRLLDYCDDDDCSGAHGCSDQCVELPGEGNYTCACPAGTVLSGGTTCIDVDECASSPCGVNAGPGGCTELPLPWVQPGYTCDCNTAGGYGFDGVTCVVANECTAGLDDCHPDATCIDPNPDPTSSNDWQCICPSGTTQHPVNDGRGPNGCVDVNECAFGLDNCATVQPDGTCINTFGAFTCGCAPGEELLGDECLPTCAP